MAKPGEFERPISSGMVAERLGVSRQTVRKWAEQGKIPSFLTPGGQRRYWDSDVQSFIDGDLPTDGEVA